MITQLCLVTKETSSEEMIQYHSICLCKLFFSGLDVNRTDRTLVFYEKKENLSKLWDILALYAWIDNDVGYCQGKQLNSEKEHCVSFVQALKSRLVLKF